MKGLLIRGQAESIIALESKPTDLNSRLKDWAEKRLATVKSDFRVANEL